ncbi:MAG TPA: DinB family protein [Flavitalea sp.]|nr:DinB family protein [Flavitalea sp.]
MKEILEQYAAYHTWANQKLAELIQSLPEQVLQQIIPSSFTTIHATLLHMWDSESIWWQRMKLQEVVTTPSAAFNGTTSDVSTSLLHQNKLWETWVKNASLAALDHVFLYQNTRKEQFKQPIYQMLLHVFNHGTYHRGQLVNMLRQTGVEKIPQTDFIVWSRKKM